MKNVTSIDRKHAEDKFVVRMPQGLRDQLKQKPRITTARPTARSSTGWSAATSSKKNSLERTEWSTSSSPEPASAGRAGCGEHASGGGGMSMAKINPQDLKDRLLAPGFTAPPVLEQLSDPISDTPMVLTLDQVLPWHDNPGPLETRNTMS